MTKVKDWLVRSFVLGQELPEHLSEFPTIPLCMRKDIADVAEFVLPSAQGTTTGFAFFPADTVQTSDSLVILSHGLGHHACESMWIWIHSFLKAGLCVLALTLDGHGRAQYNLLDLRLASRTLPLVIDRLRLVGQLRPDLRGKIFLFGHFMGATYSLLAATREKDNRLVKAVLCNAPTVSASGTFEFAPQRPPARHPIYFLRDGSKMTQYYGLGGFKRIWSSHEGKNLKGRLALGFALEAQVALFLKESLSSPEIFRDLKIPLLWLSGDRDRGKGAQVLEELLSLSQAPLVRLNDPVRASRGVQFSQIWPEKLAQFIVEAARSVESPEPLLGFSDASKLSVKRVSGEKHV